MRYAVAIVAIAIAGCDTGFGSVCDETSPAVAHARTLSQDELAGVYGEMFRLRDEALRAASQGRVASPHLVEYGIFGDAIPESLQFLNAGRIRPYEPARGGQPNIMLEGCFDEFVWLNFYDPENGGPKVELQWYRGREVLWPGH